MQMSYSGISIVGLVKELTRELKSLLKQEFDLFKTETSEKFSKLGRNSVFVAIGAVIGLIGMVLLFVALGELIAYAFENAGFGRAMSDFLGLGIMAAVVLAISAGLVIKGLKAFSKDTVVPEKTIQSIKDINPSITGAPLASSLSHSMSSSSSAKETKESEKQDERSSDQIQTQVLHTEAAVGQTMQELGERLTPRYAAQQMEVKIREKPYQWSAIAMAAGLVSSLLISRKLHHS